MTIKSRMHRNRGWFCSFCAFCSGFCIHITANNESCILICAMHAHVNIWHAYVHVGWPCTHFRLYTSRICLDGHVMCLRSFHLTSFDVPTYVISCDVTYFSSLCLSRYFSLWMMNYISLQVDWQIKWYEWHATPRKLNFRLWKCTDTSCDNITLWCM